jgi:gliding motility-associated protein GldE
MADSFLNFGVKPFSAEVGLEISFLILLLFGSALASGTEAAFFSLSNKDKLKLQSKKSYKYKLANNQLDNPDRLLAVVLILNNFINVGVVILSTYITNQLFDFSRAPLAGFFIEAIAISFILLLFGEVLPKFYANRKALSFVLFITIPLHYVSILFQPLASILISSTRIIHKRLATKGQNISVSDLSTALDLTQESAVEDHNILRGIVRFGNIAVREVMRPRVDVVAVDQKINFAELMQIVIESGYSRIPVYQDTFDNIKGVLFIKDLLKYIGKDKNFNWQTLIRPPYYVPESKKIDDLLHDFQTNKIHMAIVIDEYGGMAGVLTMEDILEEIVGDITDESDDEESSYKKLSNNVYLFEAKTHLNDFYRIINATEDEFEDAKGEAETIGGLILELKGEIPEKREMIRFGKFTFVVESSDKRRIKQVKVIIAQPSQETEKAE